MRIILCDTNESICRMWSKFLPRGGKVIVHHGMLDSLVKCEGSPHCAVISPGNSFGYLGGGFDLAIRNYLGGLAFESWFREQLGPYYHHVGSSTVVDLRKGPKIWSERGIRYIIHVPTIVAPSKPLYEHQYPMRTGYEPVFNATWNSLVSAPNDVDTLIIPGLCSGWVGVPPKVTCKSMCFALRLYLLNHSISVDLQNVLIMHFLNCSFEPFVTEKSREECRKLDIDLSRIFDVDTDPLEYILPDI
ncbi:YMR087W [Zygosaccharomyces parabailii]|nr:YMR087W [Zygosaccharomyces parabailii]